MMRFILNKTNVFSYLHEQGIYNCPETAEYQIELKPAKNFNLLVTLTDDYQLLVKQERHNSYGQTAGEFINEWRLHRLVRVYPELANIRSLISEMIHFNPEKSVIVFKYLTNYIDLSIFYDRESVFPLEIANSLGYTLATIHQATFNRLEYRDFLTPIPEELLVAQELKRITPEILAKIPVDGVQFFKLYQKYDSLGKAIAQLIESFKPCCLTHNDLKLNNILLLNNWQQVSQAQAPTSSHLVRLIDWERCGWGDPAFDLGAIVAGYLQLWLNSVLLAPSQSIQDALKITTIPLHQLQPSLAVFAIAYLTHFSEIINQHPDFLQRVLQFAGLCLIYQIIAKIQYQKNFNNTGILMLQVAKTLLCYPEQSMMTIFGATTPELTQLSTH